MFSSEADSRAFFDSANFVVLIVLLVAGCAFLNWLARKNRGVRGVFVAVLVVVLCWAGHSVSTVLRFLLLLAQAGGP